MPDKDEQGMYVALLSFACADEHGTPITIAAGQRVRAGDLTRRFSGWFVPDTFDDAEIAAARSKVEALAY